MIPVLEAVPNLSFGEDPRLLDDAVALVHRAGAEVMDRSSDPDHNRSVLTIMGHPQTVEVAVVDLAAWARDHIDLRTHRGVHPRVGALDVLPLIPLAGLKMDDVRRLARRIGVRIVEEVGVPVWFYAEASDPPGRSLAALRRGGFEALVSGCPPGREPDLVPSGWASSALHPTAGGVCVGARPVLLAWNVDVEGVPASHLREEAQRLRATSGGPAGLRVLVLDLPKQERVQVSMNLEGAESQDPFAVFLEVERCVRSLGGQVVRTEIIGMSPDALARSAAASRLSLAPGDAIRPLGEALRTHVEGRVHRAVEDLRQAVRGCKEPIPLSLQLALERLEGELMSGGGGGASSRRPVPPTNLAMTDLPTIQSAIAQDPGNVALRQALVDLAYEQEDRARLVEALSGLGEALLLQGERRRAEAAFEQVLQLDPRDLRAIQVLGRANPAGFVSFPRHDRPG